MRLLSSSPIAATASSDRGELAQHGQGSHDGAQPFELLVDLLAELAGLAGVGDRADDGEVPGPERLDELERLLLPPRLRVIGDREQAVGGSAERRHDEREARRRAGAARRPRVLARFASHDRDEPLDGLRVGHRRPAELQHAHQRSTGTASTPSATSSSALSTAAPAAPRTVLWPSAKNCTEHRTRTQTADRHGHAVIAIHVEPRLRTIRFGR